MAPVSGGVTIDGVPFTTGKVIFNPIAAQGETDAGKSSFGKLNSEGRFILSTNRENDGASVGEHRVTIFHSGEDSPYKFTRLTYPDSIFSVIAGKENEILIALTSEQVKKFGNSK